MDIISVFFFSIFDHSAPTCSSTRNRAQMAQITPEDAEAEMETVPPASVEDVDERNVLGLNPIGSDVTTPVSEINVDDNNNSRNNVDLSIAPPIPHPPTGPDPSIAQSDAAMTPLANHQSCVIPSADPHKLVTESAKEPHIDANHPAGSDQTIESFLPPEIWRKIISYLRPVDVIRHVLPVCHPFRALAYEVLRDVDWFLDWGAWYDISDEFLRNLRPPKSIIFDDTDLDGMQRHSDPEASNIGRVLKLFPDVVKLEIHGMAE